VRSGCHDTTRLVIAVGSFRLRCFAVNSCRVTVAPCCLKCFSSRSICFFMPSVPLTRGPMSHSSLRYFSARSESNFAAATGCPAPAPGAASAANPDFFGGSRTGMVGDSGAGEADGIHHHTATPTQATVAAASDSPRTNPDDRIMASPPGTRSRDFPTPHILPGIPAASEAGADPAGEL